MGEAKRRSESGIEIRSLTTYRAHGFVVQGSPLDPQPFQLVMFGKPSAPIAREFVPADEVRALLESIAPHALLLAETVGELQACEQSRECTCPGTDQRHTDAVKTIRNVFAPTVAQTEAKVEAHECRCHCVGAHRAGCCCTQPAPAPLVVEA